MRGHMILENVTDPTESIVLTFWETKEDVSLSSTDISSKSKIEMARLKTLDLEESGNCKYEIYLQPLILLRFAHIVI
jgi:hypothetical protein